MKVDAARCRNLKVTTVNGSVLRKPIAFGCGTVSIDLPQDTHGREAAPNPLHRAVQGWSGNCGRHSGRCRLVYSGSTGRRYGSLLEGQKERQKQRETNFASNWTRAAERNAQMRCEWLAFTSRRVQWSFPPDRTAYSGR